jgi:hypothetical protein
VTGRTLPTGRRLGVVAVGLLVLLVAALVAQTVTTILAVSLGIGDQRVVRGTLDLLVILAALGGAGWLLVTTIVPRFGPHYQRVEPDEARWLTIVAGGVLGGLLLLALPLVAPPEVGSLAVLPGPLVAGATAAGAVLAGRGA